MMDKTIVCQAVLKYKCHRSVEEREASKFKLVFSGKISWMKWELIWDL